MTEREMFMAALDIPAAAARTEYLDRVCGGDPARRARIEALLAAHESAGSFLGTPAAALPDADRTETMAYVPGGPDQDEESDELQFLTRSKRPDSLGRIGHYEVLQVLGKGGFGIVFRAFDDVLQRVVAVKVMAPQLAATSPARKRFLREARTSAAIRHENVVQVYEVAEQPLPYLVMEFIPGETLQQRMDRVGPLDVDETLRIGRQIAEGLAAAHATDLIHRDIKPGNVLIESGQHRVKITDFGLARAADDASISQSGIIAGTPMYMAPEQALGHKLDQRADLFSLGSVLYQMAAGRPPFRASGTVAVLKRVAEDTPRSIREIIPETPQWLCEIIAKLHAKNPDERFQSAREVADVLADCEAQLKTHSELKNFARIPKGEPVRPDRIEWWKWAAAILACVLLIPIGIILFKERVGDSSTQQVVKPVAPAPDADGWVQLFNGKDLTGWKTHPDQPGTWIVNNGILIGSSRQSHLFTERADFANFHLRAEVKINAGGDSGIRFRVPFKLLRGKEAWQVIPAGGYEAEFTKFASASAKAGSVWRVNEASAPNTLFRTVDDSLIRPEEWCTYEVIAEGNHFITKIDGREVANCIDAENLYAKGQIALQCFSAQTVVQFRKIEIKELPPSSPEAKTPPLAIAPFDAVQARKYQEAWAKHLGIEPEITNSIGMKLRLIPPGEFTKGSSEAEIETITQASRKLNVADWQIQYLQFDGPQQRTQIHEPFYLGVCEVTVADFRKFVDACNFLTDAERSGDGGAGDHEGNWVRRPEHTWKTPGPWNLSDQQPAVHVSWQDAQAFCRWLSEKEGVRYVTPEESQWEFAARAGTTKIYGSSDEPASLVRFAWTVKSLPANQPRQPQPVATKEPNAFGLFDMIGNAAEWCADWHPADKLKKRVIRGGAWYIDPIRPRPAFRGAGEPDKAWDSGTGFRVVIVGDLKPTTKPQPRVAKQEPLPPTFKNGLGMEFVIVPKGKSWLGGGKVKLGDREVEIPADFYLGKYEVTQEEWTQVMGENPSHFSRTGGGKDAVKDIPDADLKRYPVENVSWDQCQIFVAKLNKLEKETGWVYRLPKEAEWEYACRGGPMSDKLDSAFDFYFAKPTNSLLPEQANFKDTGLNQTCKVGSYAPNKLGLYEMHGNAREWCDDTERKADSASLRMTRGGGYQSDSGNCRVAIRIAQELSLRQTSFGLRLARVPAGAPSPEAKTPPSAAVQALRDVVVAKEGIRDQEKLRVDAGRSNMLDLIYAEIALTEARIYLTEAEGNAAANLAALRSLVSFREQEHDLIELKVKLGVSTQDDLLRADSSLADAKGRLAKALANAPAVEFEKEVDEKKDKKP